MELTMWIAAYGAALSSIVFGWNLYRDLTDRGRLDITPSVVQLVGVPGTYSQESERNLHLRITNTGRRQVWITNIGGRTKEKGFVLVPRNQLPKKLEPGQLIDEISPTGQFDDPKDIVFFAAYDSTGRRYRSSIRVTWTAISDLLEAQGKESRLTWGFRIGNLWARVRIRMRKSLPW